MEYGVPEAKTGWAPHGGVNCSLPHCHCGSWNLSPCGFGDPELLLNGGFSPPRSFMSCAEYEGVPCTMRLKNGVVWLISIVLDVTRDFAQSIGAGGVATLHDPEGVMLAALHVDDIWQVRGLAEPEMVCGTASTHHHRSSDCVYSIQTSSNRGWASRRYMASPQKTSETSLRALPWSSRQGICAELGECSPALRCTDHTSPRFDFWRGGLQEEISR